MMIRRIGAAALLLLVAACGSTPKVPAGATAEQVDAMAEEKREANQLDAAEALYTVVYEDYPGSPLAEPAEWLAAESAFADGRLKDARDIYQDYHEIHPVARLADLGERMYGIGETLYEEGQKGILFGIFPTMGQAVRTMEWITLNLRNGSRADDAYQFLGRIHMADENYDAATADFDALLDTYPESEWALEARYLLGVCWLELNRGPAYDLDSLRKARTAFETFLREAERTEARAQDNAARIAEARSQLAEVNTRIAEKQLVIADFYESVERPEAAKIYLGNAIRDYPDSDAAQRAAARMQEIERAEK